MGCPRNSCSHQILHQRVRYYRVRWCWLWTLTTRGPWSYCPATGSPGDYSAWEGRRLQQGCLGLHAGAHHLPPIPIHTHQPPHVQGGGKRRGTSRLDTNARCVKYPSRHCPSTQAWYLTGLLVIGPRYSTVNVNLLFRSHHTRPLILLARRSGTVENSAPIVIRTSMRCLWKGTLKTSTSEIRTPMSYVLR